MALSTYAELRAAIRTETHKTTAGLSDAVIVDAITRAEAKMNRRLRVRAMETVSTAALGASANTLSLPAGFLEMVEVAIKDDGADDSTYYQVPYVAPQRLLAYYGDSTRFVHTIRSDVEFNRAPGTASTVRWYYFKKLDLASDGTNDVLAVHPDIYLYGALAECEMHMVNDKRIPLWKSYFDEGIAELNELHERNRDDATADTSELAAMAQENRFNVLTGGY